MADELATEREWWRDVEKSELANDAKVFVCDYEHMELRSQGEGT
jgi:hypothetical protein